MWIYQELCLPWCPTKHFKGLRMQNQNYILFPNPCKTPCHFNKFFWHDENVSIENNSQIVNSGNWSASNPNHVDVSDTQYTSVFINDENILFNLSSSLKTLKTKNSKRLVFVNLNINAINIKFEQFKYIIKNNVDILIITKTKLDSSFRSDQFLIDGFAKPFHRDEAKMEMLSWFL